MNIASFFLYVAKLVAGVFIALGAMLSAHQSVTVQSPAASTSPMQFPIASSTATSTQPVPSEKVAIKILQPVSSLATSSAPASASSDTSPNLSPDVLNTQTRAALVNIECTVAGNQFEPISGSGTIVDSRGIILTNAHVGQFFLLRDWETPGNINCVVRTGSPAQAKYTAKLLYLPPQWVKDNASQIKAQTPTGTGQNDYSFLVIDGTTNPTATLPASFPYLPMSAASPDIGDEMLVAAYPAGFLSGDLIATNLYTSSAFAYVTQLFSFDTSTDHVDLFSVGGSIESQEGSSGGAVVRMDGELAGIVATASVADSTDDRDLRAITISHINTSLASAGQGGIVSLLSGDVNAKADYFDANTAPQETQELEAVLDGN